ELGARVIPYRIVNAPALRRRAPRRGGRVAEDCVMTITSIFLNRLTAEVPIQTWKSFPKRWRAIRRLGRRRRRAVLKCSVFFLAFVPVHIDAERSAHR